MLFAAEITAGWTGIGTASVISHPQQDLAKPESSDFAELEWQQHPSWLQTGLKLASGIAAIKVAMTIAVIIESIFLNNIM